MPPDDLTPWYPTLPSTASRSPARRSRTSATGSIVVRDGDRARNVDVESNAEAIIVIAVANRPDVEHVQEQPPAVEYREDGVLKRHWFDLLVRRSGGIRTAIAVKASSRVERSGIFTTVRLIAEQVGRAFADEIVVATEKSFTRDERYTAELVHESRMIPNDVHDDIVRRVSDPFVGSVAVGDLVARSELAGDGFRAVARLVGEGFFRLVDPRLDYDARIQRRHPSAPPNIEIIR